MGSFNSTPISDKKVVIVGGSYAGRAAAFLLDPIFNVTWIERRPFLIHKIMLRSLVREEWIDPTFVPNDKVLSRGNLIQGNVTSINAEDKSVECQGTDGSTQTVPYDYLLLATGATSVCPAEPEFTSMADCNPEKIKDYFKTTCTTIAKHKNILIVGGGPVGCELAGEIKVRHPDARVTLASRTEILCANMKASKADSDRIKAGLEKVGVTVKLSENIADVPKKGLAEFDAGKDFSESIKGVTLVINSTGSQPNTAFLDSNLLNEKQQIKVNEFLQISDSVYAIGDCNDVPEPKLFTTLGTKKFTFGFPTGQADIAARNILAAEAKKPLTAYKPQPADKKQMGLVPLGDKEAVALNAPGFFAKMKAKHFFFPAQWQFANYKAPKIPSAPSATAPRK